MKPSPDLPSLSTVKTLKEMIGHIPPYIWERSQLEELMGPRYKKASYARLQFSGAIWQATEFERELGFFNIEGDFFKNLERAKHASSSLDEMKQALEKAIRQTDEDVSFIKQAGDTMQRAKKLIAEYESKEGDGYLLREQCITVSYTHLTLPTILLV